MSQPGKRPSFQWYPGDFYRDAAVRSCVFEVQSLWRVMLDLMHGGEPYGHLTAGGVSTEGDLPRQIGKPAKTVEKWLAELEAKKVFSRTEAGIIYSRRMVRDEHIRNTRAASGKLGGNPNLLVNQTDNRNPSKNQPLLLQSAVASASASSPPEKPGGFVDTGEAALLIAKLRALAEDRTAPGQGSVKFLRRERVLEMGPEVAQAFDAAGGAERILTAAGKEYGYLTRDFALALAALRRPA